jgi:DUF1365 family protein
MSPHAAALLHVGSVLHIRHAVRGHEFKNRIWMLSIDLDHIDDVANASRWFRHNRFGLVSLHDRDHGARDGSPLKPWVTAQLEKAGLADAAACIRFMAIPRMAGYGFSPIAFFFCHDAEGRLRAVLHQVKSTFGEQCAYLLPIADLEPGEPSAVSQYAAKTMIVSPFFDRQGGYRFAFNRPNFATPDTSASDKPSRFDISIRYGAEAPRLTAVMSLHTRQFADAVLLRLLGGMPLMTLKVIVMIHWQAFRLYLKQVPFLGVQRDAAPNHYVPSETSFPRPQGS